MDQDKCQLEDELMFYWPTKLISWVSIPKNGLHTYVVESLVFSLVLLKIKTLGDPSDLVTPFQHHKAPETSVVLMFTVSC